MKQLKQELMRQPSSMTTLQHQSWNERGHLLGICTSFPSRGGGKCVSALHFVSLFTSGFCWNCWKVNTIIKEIPKSKTVIEGLKMTWHDESRKEDESHMFQQYVPGHFHNITSPGWTTTAAQIVADSCFLKYFAMMAGWPAIMAGWQVFSHTADWAACLQICVQIRSSTLD